MFCWVISFNYWQLYMPVTNILKTKTFEELSLVKVYGERYILQKYNMQSKETIIKKH